ncbi:MAG: translation initiation factor [Sandaracinaceae bacterium]
MAKKNKRTPSRVQAPAAPLSHNPFASLGTPAESAPTAAAPAEPDLDTRATPGFDAKVVVRREKKGRGGKTVTRVTGVRTPKAVMQAMKRSLGCGATLEGEDIVLLGEVGDRAAAWLEQEGARVVRGS